MSGIGSRDFRGRSNLTDNLLSVNWLSGLSLPGLAAPSARGLSRCLTTAGRKALGQAPRPRRCNQRRWRTEICRVSKFVKTRPMSKAASRQRAPRAAFFQAKERREIRRRNSPMGQKARHWRRCPTSPTDGRRMVPTEPDPNGNDRRNWTKATESPPVPRQSMRASR